MVDTTYRSNASAFGGSPEDERTDMTIAVVVLLFMTALGAWLMQPEQTEEVLSATDPALPVAVSPVADQSLQDQRDVKRDRIEERRARERAAAEKAAEKPAAAAAVPVAEPVQALQEQVQQQVEVPQEVVPPAPEVEMTPVESVTPEPQEIFQEQLEEVMPTAAAPATPEPAEVEQARQTRAELLERATENVSFVTGSTNLTEESQRILDELAELLIAEPDTALRIVGHTDAQGTEDNNAALSFARAEACREYLLAKGVTVGRIDTAGFGELKPIATNATHQGRERNRRVEFLLGDEVSE